MAEGRTDFGEVYGLAEGEHANRSREGALQPFIRRCAQYHRYMDADEIDFVVGLRKDIERAQLLPVDQKLSGKRRASRLRRKEMDALRIRMFATQHECDAVALHMDTDNVEFSVRYKKVRDKLERVSHLDSKPLGILPVVPKRMIESWLLADGEAYERAFDMPLSGDALRGRMPENCRGDEGNPDSLHPKRCLERAMRGCNQTVNYMTAREVAEHSYPEVLERRCPVSYGQFSEDVEELVKHW